MSPEFEELNQEALDSAEFEQRVNGKPDGEHIGEGLAYLGQNIGQGLGWLGFWIGLGLILSKLP